MTKKAVDKARNDTTAALYTKLDEDGETKMIYKMARHRNEYSNDIREEHLSRTEMRSYLQTGRIC